MYLSLSVVSDCVWNNWIIHVHAICNASTCTCSGLLSLGGFQVGEDGQSSGSLRGLFMGCPCRTLQHRKCTCYFSSRYLYNLNSVIIWCFILVCLFNCFRNRLVRYFFITWRVWFPKKRPKQTESYLDASVIIIRACIDSALTPLICNLFHIHTQSW